MNPTACGHTLRRPHTRPPRASSQIGFSRVEILVVFASLALLALVVVPALANTKPHSQRALCANNLSRIGRAFNEWASSYGDRYPMVTPSYADGSFPSGLQNNAWFQFAWVSNELVTPTILVCPSDAEKRPAQDFSFLPATGYVHPNFQNRAVSYFLGHPGLEQGRALLSGDRNLNNDGTTAACAYFSPVLFLNTPSSSAGWIKHPKFGHDESGNLLFNDGSVEQADAAGLRRALTHPGLDGAAAFHFITP